MGSFPNLCCTVCNKMPPNQISPNVLICMYTYPSVLVLKSSWFQRVIFVTPHNIIGQFKRFSFHLLKVEVGVLKSAASVLVLSQVIFVTPLMIGRLKIFSLELWWCWVWQESWYNCEAGHRPHCEAGHTYHTPQLWISQQKVWRRYSLWPHDMWRISNIPSRAGKS